MSPITSSSIPGAVSAVTRPKDSSDNPAANVLLSVYGRVPIGTDGYVLTADSTNPLGVKWSAAGGGVADPNEDRFYALAVTMMRPSKYKLQLGNFGTFTPAERIYAKSINLVKMGASASNYASVYNPGIDALLMGANPIPAGSSQVALGSSSFLSYVTETDVAAVQNAKRTYTRMMADLVRSAVVTHYQATQFGSGSGGSEKTGPTFSGNIDTGANGAIVLSTEGQGYQAGVATVITAGGAVYAGWGPPASAITDTLATDNWVHSWSGWHQIMLPIHTTMDGNAMNWRVQVFTAHADYDGFINARVATLPANWNTDEV